MKMSTRLPLSAIYSKDGVTGRYVKEVPFFNRDLKIGRRDELILVPSATRLKMSLMSSSGRTKKFEFFHWLTKK